MTTQPLSALTMLLSRHTRRRTFITLLAVDDGRIAMAAQWHLSGDYFENCNCSVVCPCLVSKAPPLTSRPTEGVCDVGVIFHIENGRYGDVTLDGLNVALAIHTPGPMGEASLIGRSAPTSTNVPTKNKRRRSEPSSPALPAGLWRLSRH